MGLDRAMLRRIQIALIASLPLLGAFAEPSYASHSDWRNIVHSGDEALRSKRFDKAIGQYQKAVDEAQAVKAEDSLLARSYTYLARAYKDKRDFDKAEECYRKALAQRKSELGENAESTLRNLEDLAYCLWSQRKYREVEAVLKEELDIKNKTGQTDIERPLEMLARIKREQHLYEDANQYLTRLLAIRKKDLGVEHNETAEIYEQMARNYREQGKLDEAAERFKSALSLRRKLHGNTNLELTDDLDSLADLYMRQMKYGDAEPLYKESLEIRRKNLPEDNVDCLRGMQRLSRCYEHMDRIDEAKNLVEKEISLLESSLGGSHIDVVSALNRLAHLQVNDEQYTEALKTAFKALEMRRAICSDKDPSLSHDVRWIASLYTKEGKYQEALDLLTRQEKLVKQLLTKNSPEYLRLLEDRLNVLRRMDNKDEAAKLEDEIKALKKSS